MPSKRRKSSVRNAQTTSFTDSFPAPTYVETVLTQNFLDYQKYFLDALLDLHAAHALMLARQRILTRKDAQVCLSTLHGLDRTALKKIIYDGTVEDFFFDVERRLEEACRPEIAGKLHTARSRNDIDLTLYRMVLRQELLRVTEEQCEVARVLLELAERHLDTIVPAYTHTQPAQPTTLAHYLMAAIEWVLRDVVRLQAAFATVNRSPLGACAITTTGFPINREYTATLLGFEGLQRNSYGAIASVDYLTEASAALAVAMVDLGRLVQDLLLWCTAEFGLLRLSDGYVQTSSIMPQKRNPVALEHARILASKAFAQAKAVLDCLHNTPFADTVDAEDDLQPMVFQAFADANRALRLFSGLMSRVHVHRQRGRELAKGYFLTVTEVADTLVRQEGLSFRQAHQLVSAAVSATGKEEGQKQFISHLRRLAPSLLRRHLQISETDLCRALDIDNFVRIRKIIGGPAPAAVRAEMTRARAELARALSWAAQKRQTLSRYPQLILKASAALGMRYR